MGTLRIGLAQINPTVGDFRKNVQRILARLEEAELRDVDLLVFPELALCGYPPEDLLLSPTFVAACREALQEVAARVTRTAVLLGTVDGEGDLYNAAAMLRDGRVVDVYRKVHLPNYGVFDELRYFEPGRRVPIYTLRGIPFAVTICEDLWQPTGPWVDAIYQGRARLVVNLSASPYHDGKIAKREDLFATRAYENHVPVAMCNLVGGQDELVFDGSSVVLGPGGEVIARAPSFEEALVVADIDDRATLGAQHRHRPSTISRPCELVVERVPLDGNDSEEKTGRVPCERQPHEPLTSLEGLYRALVLGVRDYCGKNGFRGVIVGLSGGIDSALTAAIAVEALGADKVTGVTMPSRFNSAETRSDAEELARNLGTRFYSVPIETVTAAFEASLAPLFRGMARDVTEENLQARSRGVVLMALANKWGQIVLATGNKSELATGYCTLYGDMVGGFAPIKDVYKTTVFALARHANERAGRELIPESTITRPPSAELKEDQRDEDALCPYSVLDTILRDYLELDRPPDVIAHAHELDPALTARIVRLVDRNEYKRRQGAVGLKVSARAFAKDRRFPITQRFTS